MICDFDICDLQESIGGTGWGRICRVGGQPRLGGDKVPAGLFQRIS